MNSSETATYEKAFPKKKIVIEGSSDYAKSADVAFMGHLTLVLDTFLAKLRNPVCLDIGANIGLTTLLMDQIISGGAFIPLSLIRRRTASLSTTSQ
jgi:hypothetical protein